MTNYHPLTEAQYAELMKSIDMDGGVGEEYAFACNADAAEHIHARRVGLAGTGLRGRVALMSHTHEGYGVTIFLAAEEARVFAAKVLDIADDLDGDTPLVFCHPSFIAPKDLDRPEPDFEPGDDDFEPTEPTDDDHDDN